MSIEPTYQLDVISATAGYIPLKISRDAHDALLNARKTILFGVSLEQRLDIVIENYITLQRFLLDLALQNSVFFGDASGRLKEGRHSLNRHLTNLLSSVRLYRDQTAHALSTQFGEDSPTYSQYVSETHHAYDNSLGYRCLEALRNYVQHRGMPAHSIIFSSALDEDEKVGEAKTTKARRRHFVAFSLIPKNLRLDGGFKSKVLRELEEKANRKGKVDLMPMIQDYVSGIARIHQSIRISVSLELESADAHVENMFKEIQAQTGHHCASARIWQITGREMDRTGEINLEWIKGRKSYMEKNAYVASLRHHYASSQ
ncbi:MAG: hypothetical protein ACKO45_08285 [Cyanobium sp.]